MEQFNTEAFTTKALEQGFTQDDIDTYISQRQPKTDETSTVAVLPKNFDESAFRTKATEQGIAQEDQDAYVANKLQIIITDQDFFAKPSLDLPFSVREEWRKRSVDAYGQFVNPMKNYTHKNIFGNVFIGSDKPENQAKFEKRIRNNLPKESILRIAKDLKVNPGTQDGINAIYSHAEREANWRQDKKELLANLQELSNVERPFKWIESKFNTAADIEWQSIQARNIENIAKLAKERGIDLVHKEGQFFAYDESGNLHRVTPDFLQSIGKSKYEAIGGIAGAIAGSRVPVNHPWVKLSAVAIGGLIGTVAGEEVDYLSSAITLQEELDANVALEKAVGAAQMGALFEVIGGATAKVIKNSWKQLSAAYNFIKDGNTQGAYTALKDTLGYLDDDQVQELVTRWEQLNKQAAPGNSTQEKAIAVLPSTSPGGETIVKAASQLDSRAALTVRADLNARAQTVLNLAKNTDDNTGKQLQLALKDYTNHVKASYDVVKQEAKELAPADYQFNLLNKSLRPALEETIDQIADPAIVERLQRVLIRIDDRTTSRTFSDLLELRELLNEFKYANKVTSKSKFVANQGINEAKAEVDAEIAKVMNQSDAGKQWLKDWKDVNKAYGEYKMIQKNALFKATTKPGATPKSIAQALAKHGPALDDTYQDVVSKLPVKTKALVENEIVDTLANKFAKGNESGFRAIDFPALSKELEMYQFTSSKALQLKQAVKELSEVYRNDVALFNTKPGMRSGEEASIATTVRGKAKMLFIKKVWNTLRRAKPGPQADISALISKSAKFLENPLDAKAAERVIKEIGDNAELKSAITRLQQETAKELSEGKNLVKLKMYKDKRGNSFFKPGTGRRLTQGSEIPVHRVAKVEQIEETLGRPITKVADLSTSEKKVLVDKGFMAIVLNDGRVLDLR